MKLLMKALFALLVLPISAWGQDSQSCTPPSRYVAGSNIQGKVVKVRKVEGRARAALNGTDEGHDIIMMNGICLALYSMPEGRLIATAQVIDDYFRFARIASGHYRLVSVLAPTLRFAPIDAPLEIVRWTRVIQSRKDLSALPLSQFGGCQLCLDFM